MTRAVMRWLLVVLIAAAAAAGWWAGRVVFSPPASPVEVLGPVTYEVQVGTVGRSMQFVVLAEWPLTGGVRFGESGTVTSVEIEDGDVVAVGDVVMTVGLRPVVAAEGAIPSFRPLRLKDQGEDVAQLERFLVMSGFFDGDVDGVFDHALRSAVREWQRSMGVRDNGVVQAGDLLFMDSLPVRVVVAEGLEAGVPLAPGQVVFETVSTRPEVVVPLSLEQRNLVPLSATVRIDADGVVWEGRIVQVREEMETGSLWLVLAANDGGPICGDDCGRVIPVGDRVDFPVEVVVVPETSGPLVPVAAILTEADGSTVVESVSGELISVEVVASVSGQAVVSGLETGTLVVLPGTGG